MRTSSGNGRNPSLTEEVMTLRNILVTLVLTAASLSPQRAVQAETDYVSYSNELADVQRRLAELEAQQCDDPQQTCSAISCRPDYALLQTVGCPSWMFRGDVLYWAVRNPATEYGITDIGGVQDRGAVGDVLAISPEYETGYRLSFGRRLGPCAAGPEILFTYTDFNQSIREVYAGPLRATFISSDNSENNDSDDINSLGVETITPDDRATGAAASYSFSYNVYDVEIAQALIATEHLSFRIAGVGRMMDMDQEFRVTYTGGDFQTAFTPFETCEYEGGGILLRTDLNWYLTDRLTIDFGGKAGVMLGTFNTRIFIPDDEPGVPTDVRYSERRMTTVVEMNAGVTYRRCLGRFLVSGSAGYEMTQLLDFNDHRSFSDSHQEGQNSHLLGNISLDGLYARAGIEF